MKRPEDSKIESILMGVMTHGFNRALNALESAGAIDKTKLNKNYRVGSKYYDIVTEQFELTAKNEKELILQLFDEDNSE